MMTKLLPAALAAVLLTASANAEVRGHYLESRNAEIYASHCFANSEIGILGDRAVMAWSVEAGALDGVSLDGLSVVAVIKAGATLGDPFANPLPTKTMLIFDERATTAQRAALEKLARRAAGELIAAETINETAPIAVDFHGDFHAKRATLTAGELVKLETRAIRESDSLCHLDNIYYAPLVELDHAMPAFALVHSFRGEGLGGKYDEFRRSSAYLGAFVLNDVKVSD